MFPERTEGDALVPDEPPESWRPPVVCPECGTDQARFVTLRYEMSVYACEVCHLEFEVEE